MYYQRACGVMIKLLPYYVGKERLDPDLYEEYVSTLNEGSRSNLKKEIDWDNKVDRDLIEIADSMMADWEVTLSASLGLSRVQIEDVKARYKNDDPRLERYNYNILKYKRCLNHSSICG